MPPAIVPNKPELRAKLFVGQRRAKVETRARGLSQNPIVIHDSVTWHRECRLRFFVGEERNNIWYRKNCISGH